MTAVFSSFWTVDQPDASSSGKTRASIHWLGRKVQCGSHLRFPKMRPLNLAEKVILSVSAMIMVTLLIAGATFLQTRQLAAYERINTTSDKALSALDQIHIAALHAENLDDLHLAPAEKSRRLTNKITSISQLAAEGHALLSKDRPDLLPLFDRYANVERRNVVELESGDPGESDADDALYESVRKHIDAWSGEWDVRGDAAVAQTGRLTLIAAGLVTVFCIAACAVIIGSVTRPVRSMTTAMLAIADGNLGVTIPAKGRDDEVGQMAGAVAIFQAAALEKLRLEHDDAKHRERIARERRAHDAELAVRAAAQDLVVGELARALNALAWGNLTICLDTPFASDYEELRGDFNATVEQLREAVAKVARHTVGLECGVTTMRAGSDQLSQRTSRQMQNLRHAAERLADITETVKQTADAASTTEIVIEEARASAHDSGDVVRRASAKMAVIEEASRRIAGFSGLIDQIAAQTNLLSLNAAVEAARAGEQGRGFAVVASEVRTLAKQSSDAAAEIRRLTAASEINIREGVGLVTETGQALQVIVDRFMVVSEGARQIITTTRDQSRALSEVNTAIAEVDRMTELNFQLVEDATQSLHDFSDETSRLVTLVSNFTIAA
ncbi:methyl-accepting chemotaxis protein [Sphingomonas immobilis]|uniref:Methyl-accepting chemotaxis protein n=1 Tax=Sphingomonas immobilis TaxID=3063997 RepID=A0ABT9A236_9SPHN|nr:methyl-accepting chemotaxis protein [Sphingomonas sp. CA1-15]MDO7843424.1 methyl-accepting chemotaxis protein [Sphingomonas sp. CA1-15]